MAVTVTYGDKLCGNEFGIPFQLTLDSSYVTGGETLTAANFGLDRFERFTKEDSEGYTYDFDIATGGATATVKVYYTDVDGAITAEDIKLTDSNTAETDGVAVYLHTKDGQTGWLEFVSPTDADGTGTLVSGGNSFFIFDSDAAATDGVAVYFDEDATIVDERLMAVNPSNQDVYVPVGGGQYIKIKDNDTAATDGVGVYFDEDGTNAYDRLLYISPTNTDGTGATDDQYLNLTLAGTKKLEEVASGTDLSSVTINCVAWGR